MDNNRRQKTRSKAVQDLNKLREAAQVLRKLKEEEEAFSVEVFDAAEILGRLHLQKQGPLTRETAEASGCSQDSGTKASGKKTVTVPKKRAYTTMNED